MNFLKKSIFLIIGLFLLFLCCLALFYIKTDENFSKKVKSAPSAFLSALSYKLGNFHPDSKITVPIKGNLEVRVLDNQNICIVGVYSDFLKDRFKEECGSFLQGIDSPMANLKEWSKNVFYNVLGAEIILKYRPTISNAYKNFRDFKFSGGIEVSQGGYWLNPIGQFAFPLSDGNGEKLTRNAEVAHFAFFKLKKPLVPNKEYFVLTPLDERISFTFNPEKENPIIKTNQVGYSPFSGRKFAYIGAWRGTLGALPTSNFEGKKFEILKLPNFESRYTGYLTARQDDTTYKGGAYFTGEEVLEADFSAFNEKGNFVLSVEGLGRSCEFSISNDAIGEAFYIHSKGLYHKRCAIAKEAPYTNWLSGKCHSIIYSSNFPPNNKHYKIDKNRADGGFFDAENNPISVKQFNLIALNANTNTPLSVYGGWHDAADYDRRSYHYDVVCDLLAAYLYKPQNFSDAQLNIPESGNGIADIIDEAIWGMEIWRQVQKSDGSVGGWIEADSHPKEYNPAKDTQPYFLSAATRESTMQYAAHASMLALVLKNAGNNDLSKKWLNSAMLAFDWALKAENRFSAEYIYPKNEKEKNSPMQKIKYLEPKEIPPEFEFKAAFNLFLLTNDKTFLNRCESLAPKMRQSFIETSWKINPFLFSEFIKYGKDYPSLSSSYEELKKRVLMYADERLDYLENSYPYRIAWYPPSHAYVSHMSWGNFHPFRNAKYFVNAYEISGEKKYRDAAYLCNDFHNGANPFGQTMTSNLGKNYPVRFLDLPSYSDGISEYVQGITPYRNTFGINRDDIKLAHALIYDARKDRDFNPEPVMLLPESVIGKYTDIDELSKKIANAFPIWRRFTNIEAYTVAASEYTVSETISPSVAVCGWLLEPDWKPSEELKNKVPAKDIRKLKGYAPLP